jgi:bidirectional [NiFe] hydrogenase diaphorase subunit
LRCWHERRVDVKTLTIDGQEVSARAGQTILEVAREHNIDIPTLCHLDGLSDVGACRLCLVEIKGNNKLLPACVPPSKKAWKSPPPPSG